MRTLLILIGGIVLLTTFVLVARVTGGGNQKTLATAALAFLPVWLVATGYNMWVGVNHAGYSVAEEAPILALLFGVPAAAALIVWRRFSR